MKDKYLMWLFCPVIRRLLNGTIWLWATKGIKTMGSLDELTCVGSTMRATQIMMTI